MNRSGRPLKVSTAKSIPHKQTLRNRTGLVYCSASRPFAGGGLGYHPRRQVRHIDRYVAAKTYPGAEDVRQIQFASSTGSIVVRNCPWWVIRSAPRGAKLATSRNLYGAGRAAPLLDLAADTISSTRRWSCGQLGVTAAGGGSRNIGPTSRPTRSQVRQEGPVGTR